ncbi:MAG TPA: hypothetical protein VJ461_01660 [Candidatus Nanoarchaeia archaeon]|nr:hypothetical protein [Candidatus Nanoarchaeia archaeon]
MMFENFTIMLYEWGVMDILLPFILIFTIVFATLQKTKILGEGKKQYNVVVALVMGLAVVIPHVTGAYIGWWGFDPVDVINTSLPQVSIILVAIVMLLLIIGVFGNEFDIAGTPLAGWVVIFALIAVVLIFGSSVHWFSLPIWLGFLQYSYELQALIVMILVFGIIIWFITKEDKKEDEQKGLGKWLESFGKAVKKK